MTDNKLFLYLLCLIFVFAVVLCGCAKPFEITQNSTITTIKSTDFDNTFVKNTQNDAEKPRIMPDTDDSSPTPGREPNKIEEILPKTQTASKSAHKNLVSGKIVIEQSTKRVLASENEDEKLYPASTTKVLTALCVLNSLPLDRVVTVPKQAAGVEGSSIYLKAGQRITVEDLLYGLMLRSGNDAAVTLALETSGSIEIFANLMNKTARECGATNSNFVNPHGLQDENHYTTARDLAHITAKAYENKEFVRIVSTKTRKIKIDDEEIVVGNKNKMLKLYDGANGVKTGFTKSSGRCLVSGAKKGNMQLISVVLNCSDMWNESVRLLDFGFDNFEMIPLDSALLTDGINSVEFKADSNVDEDWRDKYFPVKKDGSEKLVILSQAF